MEITLKNIERQLKNVVENAPFPIGVYVGKEMTVALANRSLIAALGKGDGIIGKSYFEILPELGSQGIYEKLLEVLETGDPYTARNSRVDLLIGGKLEPHYFNYTFTPLRNGEGRVYGVMNTGADVTDICLSRQQNAEAEEKCAWHCILHRCAPMRSTS